MILSDARANLTWRANAGLFSLSERSNEAVMRAISISALCIHITNMDFLAAFIDIYEQKCS